MKTRKEKEMENKVWHSFGEKPNKSGSYIVYTKSQSITTIDYSAKYQEWNCDDETDKDVIRRSNMTNRVIAWAYCEDIVPSPLLPYNAARRDADDA